MDSDLVRVRLKGADSDWHWAYRSEIQGELSEADYMAPARWNVVPVVGRHSILHGAYEVIDYNHPALRECKICREALNG